MLQCRPAHCLVTPGGGVSLGLGQGSATHPPTHRPPPPPGGSMPSTHSQSRTDQQKITTNGVGTQNLENRVLQPPQLPASSDILVQRRVEMFDAI